MASARSLRGRSGAPASPSVRVATQRRVARPISGGWLTWLLCSTSARDHRFRTGVGTSSTGTIAPRRGSPRSRCARIWSLTPRPFATAPSGECAAERCRLCANPTLQALRAVQRVGFFRCSPRLAPSLGAWHGGVFRPPASAPSERLRRSRREAGPEILRPASGWGGGLSGCDRARDRRNPQAPWAGGLSAESATEAAEKGCSWVGTKDHIGGEGIVSLTH